VKRAIKKISEAKNADGSSIEAVKSAIKGAGDVFDKLIGALTKLVDVAKEAGDTNIGDANNAGAAVAADENSVKAVIANVKEIIDAADKSGVKIELGNAGNQVTAGAQTDAPAALAANNNAQANSGPKLAEEVSKADPWAMINKIKNAKTGINLAVGDNNEVGALATKIADANSTGAKTNADLAAAVALKAMTKGGKFSHAANEDGAVKAAAVSAVNKILGVLDVIIRKTVSSNLNKIREAVKGIQYSETTTEAIKASTTQPTATK
ncbi:VlpB32, partial (plasmid) [Borrelia hermsii HS1]